MLRLRSAARGLGGIVVAILLWELARAVTSLGSAAPSFPDICSALGHGVSSGDVPRALGESVKAWGAGLAATIVVGIAVGALIGLWPSASLFLGPLIDFLRPVPSVAYIPLVVVWFGVGLKMQIFVITMASIWPIVFNTRFGLRDADPTMLDNARVMGLGPWTLLWRVRARAALPAVFTGIKAASAIAVIVTVASELIVTNKGLGGFISLAEGTNDTSAAFAGLLVAGGFGYAVYLLVSAAERRMTRWHRGMLEAGR